jgi:hypothetical protein
LYLAPVFVLQYWLRPGSAAGASHSCWDLVQLCAEPEAIHGCTNADLWHRSSHAGGALRQQAFQPCRNVSSFTIIPLQTFWHSSSHALGEALEAEFGADLTIGPALEEGFYYDCYLGDRVLSEADKPRIQKHIDKVGL